MKDPWLEASSKYQAGQVVSGTILKINPFGLFVKLDEEIHGLAHISQLNLETGKKINEIFQPDEVRQFEIVSISPSEHRLGLRLAGESNGESDKQDKSEKKSDNKDSSVKSDN